MIKEKIEECGNIRGISSQPDGRESSPAELVAYRVLTIVESVTETDWMIPTKPIFGQFFLCIEKVGGFVNRIVAHHGRMRHCRACGENCVLVEDSKNKKGDVFCRSVT